MLCLLIQETLSYRKLLTPEVSTCSTTVSPGMAAAKAVPLKATGLRRKVGPNSAVNGRHDLQLPPKEQVSSIAHFHLQGEGIRAESSTQERRAKLWGFLYDSMLAYVKRA